MKSRNSDYGSYCNSPTDLAGTVVPQDISTDGDTLQNSPLLPTSEEEDNASESTNKSEHPLDSVKLEMPPVTSAQETDRFQPDKIPGEPLKTLLSALFLGTGFLATTTSLALTHERVPDIQPLPDIVLDNIKYQSWGLDVSEYLLMFSTISALIVVMLHSHRLIILRRIWLLLGVLYYYRALTMFVTVLPKADETYTCMPRKNDTSALGKPISMPALNFLNNLLFRLHQACLNNNLWRRPLHQWEAHLLWRLHILWPHNDPHHGLPDHQTM